MWDWATGEIRRVPDQALSGLISVDAISGNQHLILRAELVAKVGLPDSRLFFGLEELEYCLRIRAAGYRLLVDGDLMREYRARSGHLRRRRRRLIVPHCSYASIWRQDDSTRNYIFAMTRTFQHPELARRELFKAIGRTCFSWARGPRYGSAFTRLQIRGVVDGYLGRMGRTVIPTPKVRERHGNSRSFREQPVRRLIQGFSNWPSTPGVDRILGTRRAVTKLMMACARSGSSV